MQAAATLVQLLPENSHMFSCLQRIVT